MLNDLEIVIDVEKNENIARAYKRTNEVREPVFTQTIHANLATRIEFVLDLMKRDSVKKITIDYAGIARQFADQLIEELRQNFVSPIPFTYRVNGHFIIFERTQGVSN